LTLFKLLNIIKLTRAMKGEDMKKNIGNILVILSVLFVLTILNLFHNNTGLNSLNAYTPGQENCYPPYIYGPDLVNAMQGLSGGTCPTSGPPADSNNDYEAWHGYSPLPYSTPGIILNSFTSEACTPSTQFGTGYLRVTWTGGDLGGGVYGSNQYIYLSSDKFENLGCNSKNNDWSCYDYVRFYVYDSFCKNYSTATMFQTASIYDVNGVTITGGSVMLKPVSAGIWDIHWTASLNYLRNQYDINKGAYIDINNLAGFIINAVNTDYSVNWPQTSKQIAGDFPPSPQHILIYYDYLSLGEADKVPEYGSPTGISVSTARDGSAVLGAHVRWDFPPNPEPTPGIPIAGYHIYRSLNTPGGNDPYVPVGIVSSYDVNNITDTACPGGNTYCYKVLILNNGPATSADLQKLNTINATYHESLLADVPQYCGWVDAPPPTPTFTATMPPGGWPTATFTSSTPPATPTATQPPPQEGIGQAHVYPNPYNPNKGSGKFYVDNVVDKTKIYIYAMDGSLVKDGVFNSTQNRFSWDGLNKNGSKVVSGLYYLVLESPSGETRVLRIIVCYDCDPVYKP